MNALVVFCGYEVACGAFLSKEEWLNYRATSKKTWVLKHPYDVVIAKHRWMDQRRGELMERMINSMSSLKIMNRFRKLICLFREAGQILDDRQLMKEITVIDLVHVLNLKSKRFKYVSKSIDFPVPVQRSFEAIEVIDGLFNTSFLVSSYTKDEDLVKMYEDCPEKMYSFKDFCW